jgi:hypothetical protein
VCLGGYENSRTTPVFTFASLFESVVTVRCGIV